MKVILSFVIVIMLVACTNTHATAQDAGYHVARASWYGGGNKRLEPNTHMANGHRFDRNAHTFAHLHLPFGTVVTFCYRGCVAARCTDRGPASWTGRQFDLSRGTAAAIGFVNVGVGSIRYHIH